MFRGWGCGGGIAGCCGIWSTWWTSGACTCEIFPHVKLTLGRVCEKFVSLLEDRLLRTEARAWWIIDVEERSG